MRLLVRVLDMRGLTGIGIRSDTAASGMPAIGLRQSIVGRTESIHDIEGYYENRYYSERLDDRDRCYRDGRRRYDRDDDRDDRDRYRNRYERR